MEVRIDKYIWAVRLSKTRSKATELIKKKKVRLNGEEVKPAKEVQEGDKIEILKNNAVFTYKIKALLEKRVGAKLVADYLIDITAPEEIEKFETYRAAQSSYRAYGTGKPNKKDRRALEEFLKRDF